jgi:hypothetical protein
MGRRRLVSTGLVAAGLLAGLGAAAQSLGIPEYTATYDAYYKSKRVGSSEFSVTALDTANQYQYRSSTRVKGLLRLVAPNPAIDVSRFEVVDGGLRPLQFSYEDGSRKGEDNFTLDFDWSAKVATAAGDFGQRMFDLHHGMLDRGSVQVEIMRRLGSCRAPGSFEIVNDDGASTYDYEPIEPADAETGLGMIPAERYQQQREGSSRRTVLWVAPSLSYLPVRIEQYRNGELDTAFVLDSIDGISKSRDPC